MPRNEERYLLKALELEGTLRARLYQYTRDSSVVEELLQDTYARLLTAAASDEPEVRSIRAYALAISRNVAFDWLRHRRRVPIELVADMESSEELDDGAEVEGAVNGHHELATLVGAIQAMPVRRRQVFTLRKVYGYSQREIASRLSIAESTVEQHLTKAARRCAQALFDQPAAERRTSFFNRFRTRNRGHVEGE